MSNRIVWSIISIAIWLISMWLLGGCLPSTPSNMSQSITPELCPTVQTSPTPTDLPDFLKEVRPQPNSTIKLNCYLKSIDARLERGGITAIVSTGSMADTTPINLDGDDVFEMVDLYVDTMPDDKTPYRVDVELSLLMVPDSEGNIEKSIIGPRAYIYLPIILDPDRHQATVRVRTASGKVLEYSWSFTIEP